ncbi:MAG: TRAP transporter small permease subunit [Thermodesulfobacteriota bacterium]|nr:TRAP transporter small permease subunit [Thermodesulfobacteriota bacterium]
MSLIENSINNVNDKVGYYTAFLVLPLILVVVYEVAMRYLFNAPTKWAFEATTLLYGCHFALGFAYTHKNNGHVSIDIFESRLTKKPRTTLRIIVNLLLFVPTMGLLAMASVRYAADSWRNWELASTSWAPPLYPFKTILCIGFILLFLQGIAKLIADFRSLKD